MKRSVAFLTCLIMVLSLVSCGVDGNNDNQTTFAGLTQETENEAKPNKKYFDIESVEQTMVKYYIYDINGNTVLADKTSRPLDISMLGEYVVDIHIGMGTGTSIHKYYDVQSNRFSEEYS